MNCLYVMRIHPIVTDRNGSTASIGRTTSNGKTISQQKPPLHTTNQQQYHQRRNENAINEIMEVPTVTTKVPDALLAATPHDNVKKTNIGTNFIHDEDDDFMTRIVDGTCQGIFPSSVNNLNDDNNDRPSLCNLPSCQLVESFTTLMHCRQPLSFLTFFHEVQTDEGVEVVQLLPAGAYLLPKECEYCGTSDTKLCCTETCPRPTYYLQKKRPPFGKLDSKWDPISDHAIPVPVPPPPPPPDPDPEISAPSRSPGSWVSDLFRRNGDTINH